MKITTTFCRYNARVGWMPKNPIGPLWFAQDAFADTSGLSGLSDELMQPQAGVTHGHNVMTDSGFMDGLWVDREVPISPLFARDLAGRAIYLGYGPELKDNAEWSAYAFPEGTPPEDMNVFIPLITFPRFCRDVADMEGAELLEEVLFCKFRHLEQPLGYYVQPSGADAETEPLAPIYNAANLYPYKLRLDTFYPDGYRLPQTQMLFARNELHGINPAEAEQLGQELLQAWASREAGTRYEDWYAVQGDNYFADLFERGCTLIPTFEAFNGVALVGREFELQDFWPGRAVVGLHEVLETRPDQAPYGTILEVIVPGYVTGTKVVQAQVIVSDGSGYVSPNAADPLPMVPNLNLPHVRSVANWRACWLPTHPQHFESPALWGWEPESGKFMQLTGPLWAPLYYFYECTDRIIDAYDFPEVDEENPELVPVPTELKGRFWPIIPMRGFDTFNTEVRATRSKQGSKLSTIIVRQETEEPVVGVAYHPLPIEFEVDIEPFWFPELHPLNRGHGLIPDELADRLPPVITPQLPVETYLASVVNPDPLRPWFTEPIRMGKVHDTILDTYPHLLRYLVPDLSPEAIFQMMPYPILSDLSDLMNKNPTLWWAEEFILDDANTDVDEGTGETKTSLVEMDTPDALNQLGAGLHDVLWDAREAGVDWVRFRHMVYQTNLPFYILSYWGGASPEVMMEQMESWIKESGKIGTDDDVAPSDESERASSPSIGKAAIEEDDGLTEAERAQLRALEAMANAREVNRLEPVGAVESVGNPGAGKFPPE